MKKYENQENLQTLDGVGVTGMQTISNNSRNKNSDENTKKRREDFPSVLKILTGKTVYKFGNTHVNNKNG